MTGPIAKYFPIGTSGPASAPTALDVAQYWKVSKKVNGLPGRRTHRHNRLVRIVCKKSFPPVIEFRRQCLALLCCRPYFSETVKSAGARMSWKHSVDEKVILTFGTVSRCRLSAIGPHALEWRWKFYGNNERFYEWYEPSASSPRRTPSRDSVSSLPW